MASVITHSEIINYSGPSSTERSPVNVEMFFSFLNNSLETLFDATDSNATDFKEKKDNLVTYLENLYSFVIIKEKVFKRSLRTYNAATHDGVTKFSIKDTIWVGVIKGNSNDKNIHPFMSDNVVSGSKKYTVPIVTVKLFQACISLMVSKQLGCMVTKLAPAPICAHIFAACKSSAAKENNWAIYGHYGLNFVANYIWSQRVGIGKKEEETDEVYKERLAWLGKLPKVHDLLMVAMRLDENMFKAYQKEKLPTIVAIIRTCQLLQEDMDEMIGLIKVEDWPASRGPRCFAFDTQSILRQMK